MARTQVDSSVRAEALQTVATPRVQGAVVQADPRSNKAFALAEALGTAQPKIDAAYNDSIKKVEEDAKAFAGSLSAEDLGNKIKNGELPNFKSPVFVAQVKRIYGENQVSSIANQVSEDIKNGNVAFNNDQELDSYVNKKREEVLSGADRFTVAGFDSKLNDLKNQLRKQNTTLVSKRTADEAEAVAFQNFKDIYEYSKSDESITAEDRIALMTERYASYRRDGILPSPEKQRDMLINIARVAAENKDKVFLDKFLKSNLSDGMSVERVLGPDGLDKLNTTIDRVQTSQYYKGLREKNDATNAFTDAMEERLAAGKDFKDLIDNEETYGALSKTARTRLANGIKKSLAEGGILTRERMQEIGREFDGITDPQEALFLKQQLLSRAGSKEERNVINVTHAQGKFHNSLADPAFQYGMKTVQGIHNSTDFAIGSSGYGAASRKFMDDFTVAFNKDSKELYLEHKDVIPEEFKDRQMSRLPIQIKQKIAAKIANAGANQFQIGLPGGDNSLSPSSRLAPINPNSSVVIKKGESITQNGIVIQKTKD